MKSRLLLVTLVAAAVAVTLFFWLRPEPAGTYGRNALEQTKSILAFGPRPAVQVVLWGLALFVAALLRRAWGRRRGGPNRLQPARLRPVG